MLEGGENQHDSWIKPPSYYLEACASFMNVFFFLPSGPSSLSTSIYSCSNSCPAITTQPTPLISLPPFVLSCSSSRPHSMNLLFFHFLSHDLIIFVHPPCEPLTSAIPSFRTTRQILLSFATL